MISSFQQLINDLPPMRTIDDFLMGSARFQKPNVNDIGRWNNRVINNLLYYQTNYFLLAIIVFCIFGICQPWKTLSSICTIVITIYAIVNYVPRRDEIRDQNGFTNKALIVGGTVLIFFFLYILSAVLFVLLILLLPFCISFIHASLRLRNLRNKLSTTFDERLRNSPMGIFLESMSITIENSLK